MQGYEIPKPWWGARHWGGGEGERSLSTEGHGERGRATTPRDPTRRHDDDSETPGGGETWGGEGHDATRPDRRARRNKGIRRPAERGGGGRAGEGGQEGNPGGGVTWGLGRTTMRHRPTRRHNEDDDATKIKESDALGEGGAKEGASQEGWVPARGDWKKQKRAKF